MSYVKGKRRKCVEAVHDAAGHVLAAKNYAEAYVCFAELANAISALDDQIAAAFTLQATKGSHVSDARTNHADRRSRAGRWDIE